MTMYKQAIIMAMAVGVAAIAAEEQEVRKVDRDNEVYLRTAGDDGVKCYRIPGVDTTRKGSLIAVYDVRHRSGRDLPGG